MSHSGAGRRLAVLSALTVLGLAGCGQEAPGVAASIDGEQITLEQVDTYASAVCTYNEVNAEVSGQPAQPVSGENLRGFAIDLLVQQTLTERVAENVGASVPAAAGAQPLDPQTKEVIAAMPADEGAVISEIVSTSQRNAALQQAIGAELAAEGGEGAGQQAVAEALAEEEANADIDINPRLAEAYAARTQERGASAPTQESQLAVPVSAEDAGEDAPSCS